MAKKEYNKSLSARIRRRNAQGFEGLGTGHMIANDGHIMTYSSEKVLLGHMGDYSDPIQNNKYELGINAKGDVIPVLSKHQHLVNAAKKYGIRHVGSSSAKTLASHF